MSIELTNIENDCLKEMANVGGGHAVAIISDRVGMKAVLDLPIVEVKKLSEVDGGMGDTLTVYSRVKGEEPIGNMAVTFPKATYVKIKELLSKDNPEEITDDDRVFFTDVGENVIKAYAAALNPFLGISLETTQSDVMFTTTDINVGSIQEIMPDEVLVVKIGYIIDGTDVRGDLDMLFAPTEVEYLLRRINVQFGM